MGATCCATEVDELLDALADVQRRKLLVSLMEHNPQNVGVSAVGADAAQRRVEMTHVHLPKLETYGLVDWDRRTREVVKGPNFDEIRPLLELLVDHEEDLPGDWL